MLANFLEKSKPINFIVYLSSFFFLFFVHTFLNFYINNLKTDYLLNNFLIAVLLLGLFFAFIFIIKKNRLTFDNTYAFFILLLSTILFFNELNNLKSFVTVFSYLLLLRRLYSLQTNTNVLQKLFDCGLWLGVMCIINTTSVVFILLIVTAIFLHHKKNIHTLVSPIIGFVCPIIIYYTYLLYFEDISNKKIQVTITNLIYSNKNYFDTRILTIILLSVIAFLLKSPRALSISNSFKKSWILLACNAIVAFLFYFYENNNNSSEIVLFLIPITIIIGNGLEVIKKSLYKDLLLGLFVIATLVYYFFQLSKI